MWCECFSFHDINLCYSFLCCFKGSLSFITHSKNYVILGNSWKLWYGEEFFFSCLLPFSKIYILPLRFMERDVFGWYYVSSSSSSLGAVQVCSDKACMWHRGEAPHMSLIHLNSKTVFCYINGIFKKSQRISKLDHKMINLPAACREGRWIS